ncbi:MAG: glutathione S-transferase family protein [Gemmatimonadaceae bacterium]|nr:glutathione S-transferase family protein [Gemmatimonadaceae bacterium]
MVDGDPGEFVRSEDAFRGWVTADGSSGYPAEAGRYHLYVSWACPWAHRTIVVRELKGLGQVVPMTAVDPIRDERGWAFREGEGHGPDPVNGFEFLSQAYEATDPGYRGRITVPVLWDRKSGRILSNADDDLMRMMTREFDAFTDRGLDLYPKELREEIDEVNDLVYPDVNDGVYRCGFARSQGAYDRRVRRLFATLDLLEDRLAGQRYLVNGRITEADWRLFVTLVRFDAVYHGHFKCNLRRIVDYPNLSGYLQDLYQQPGIAETVNFDHIKRHYYGTHPDLNPGGIVPVGPEQDLTAPHDRASLGPDR